MVEISITGEGLQVLTNTRHSWSFSHMWSSTLYFWYNTLSCINKLMNTISTKSVFTSCSWYWAKRSVRLPRSHVHVFVIASHYKWSCTRLSKDCYCLSPFSGVRSPVATDLSRKKGSDSSTAKTLGNRCECHGSSEMTIINGRPVSQ